MSYEIERKFLVDDLEEALSYIDKVELIRQGYFHKDVAIRVRTINDEKAYIAIKDNGTLLRKEFEYEIPIIDARWLLASCGKNYVEKLRYYTTCNAEIWTIDVFRDFNQGLVLAEIELRTEEQHVVIPSWLGKEVTEDKRYSNLSIATKGVP